MKTRIIQKAVVVFDGKLLALKRGKTDVRRPGQWDLPGGFLDDGEDFETGVVREIKEEAGMDAKDPKLIFAKTEVRKWLDNEGSHHEDNCVFLFYLLKAESDQVTISYEHSESSWMTIEEAIENWKYDLHLELFRHLQRLGFGSADFEPSFYQANPDSNT